MTANSLHAASAERLNKYEKEIAKQISWVDASTEMPTKAGKYVVKTKTSMGNSHKVECQCTITNNKASFNVTNQIVTHWLKEN